MKNGGKKNPRERSSNPVYFLTPPTPTQTHLANCRVKWLLEGFLFFFVVLEKVTKIHRQLGTCAERVNLRRGKAIFFV